MQRPIEKYGWKKACTNESITIIFYKGDTFKQPTGFFAYHIHNKKIFISTSSEITFKELEAIYETAKQINEVIKDEN